jgi:hypothetical protein
MQVITPSAQPQRTAELLLNQRSDESEANRGRLRGEVVLIGRGVAEVGVPAVEVVGQVVVEDSGADLEQEVNAT